MIDENMRLLGRDVADAVMLHLDNLPLRDLIKMEVTRLLERIAADQKWESWPCQWPE